MFVRSFVQQPCSDPSKPPENQCRVFSAENRHLQEFRPNCIANWVRSVLVYTLFTGHRVPAELPCSDMVQRFKAECGSQLFRAKVQAESTEHCYPHCYPLPRTIRSLLSF